MGARIITYDVLASFFAVYKGNRSRPFNPLLLLLALTMADMLVDIIRAQGVLVDWIPYEATAPFSWYAVKIGRVPGLYKRK